MRGWSRLGIPAHNGDSGATFQAPPTVSPPDLPTATPRRSSADRFIDLTAKLSLALGALGIVWCLFQLLMVALLGRLDIVALMQRDGLVVPDWVQWTDAHAFSLSVALLLFCIAFVVVCCAMLKRHEWGRIGFIVFLLLVALGNFAFIPVMDSMFNSMLTIFPADFLSSPQGAEMRAQMAFSRWSLLITLLVSSLAIAALHGWLAIKLQRRDVRDLFH